MPSDDRVSIALGALARPIGEFRAALAGALEQANAYVAQQRSDPAMREDRAARELGAFATGRLNVNRFAALFKATATLAPENIARVEKAVRVLEEVLAQGEGLFIVNVAPRESLARTVEDALSRIGRAFGAIVVVELVRGNSYRPLEHDDLLEHRNFRAWSRDERRFAPPLVVTVDGADLHVGGLSDFTDGRQKIVLVVRGDCSPAALVRLITPGTLVLQTNDSTGLDRVATTDGPAIAAMVPESAAHFLHDPLAGKESWQRLTVWNTPTAPTRALGGSSAWQMAEDLRQLGALAAAPIGAAAPSGAPVAGPDTVDRLAQWLLTQSDLKGAV